MEPEFIMPVGTQPRPNPNSMRRPNTRFYVLMSLLAMGGTFYYLHYRDRPKSARHIFISPTETTGPKPYMRYRDFSNASSSNNKGTNTQVRTGREPKVVKSVSVERSGGGV